MSTLAIDIGSRFADLAFADSGQVQVLKFPVLDRSEGAAALGAINTATNKFGFSVGDLTSVRIGSTGALNAVLRRKGARVALLATQGFSDTFFLARQNRQSLYDPVATGRTPDFLLAEADVHPVAGRIGADGAEVAPLDQDALARIADQLHRDDVDSIAVCLLFAHLNPAHELACLEVLARRCPDIPVSLSHRIDPQPREYERTVSVCLDAWLKPRFTHAISEISEGLAAQGFGGQLLFGDGRGVLMSAQTALALPATALASGPAAAARLGATLPASGPAKPRLIMDIGSVSCDLSFARAGALPPLVAGAVYGDIPVRREMVDLHSLALGARHAAVLHPDQSITFELNDTPDQPTLELALRTCGRVDPAPSSDDLKPLEKLAAQTVWSDALEAAKHVIAAAELEVAAAVVNFAVRRNIDPAHAQLVAMGGLGPLLAAGVAEILSIREILLPEAPAAAGALGLLQATPRYEAAATLGLPVEHLTPQLLHETGKALADDIAQQTAALTPETAVVTIAATAQMHPMQIELSPPPQTPQEISDAFRAAYLTRYGIAPPGGGYVFSLLLRRDGTGATTPPLVQQNISFTAEKPERYETIAGTIHIPAAWHLSQTKGGFSLRFKEPLS